MKIALLFIVFGACFAQMATKIQNGMPQKLNLARDDVAGFWFDFEDAIPPIINASIDIRVQFPGPAKVCYSLVSHDDGGHDDFDEFCAEADPGSTLELGGTTHGHQGRHIINIWCLEGCSNASHPKAVLLEVDWNHPHEQKKRDILDSGSFSCYSHSCSIDCPGAAAPVTQCTNPTGQQWLPSCSCSGGAKATACSFSCFTHNCQTGCSGGRRANCGCSNPTGRQWLPFCSCV